MCIGQRSSYRYGTEGLWRVGFSLTCLAVHAETTWSSNYRKDPPQAQTLAPTPSPRYPSMPTEGACPSVVCSFCLLPKLRVPGDFIQHLSIPAFLSRAAPPLSSRCDPLSESVSTSASELTSAEFGTLHYGCQGEIASVLFNDGPEAAPFMVTVEMDGGHRMGGAEEQGGKEKLPFEVCGFLAGCTSYAKVACCAASSLFLL